MEIKIKRDKVTHIQIHDYSKHGFTWLSEFTVRYWIPYFNTTYLEGYYRRGRRDAIYPRITKEEVHNSVDLVDLGDGELKVRPHVKIFAGNELLVTHFFSSLQKAEDFISSEFGENFLNFKYTNKS